MFDLDKAIASWRRTMTYNHAFTADDLDELEQHVRDQVAELRAQGLLEKEAFRQALGEMGSYGEAEAEYRKVYWGKMRRRHQLTDELTWRLSMLKNYFTVAFRNLRRSAGYTFINVAGLAVGMACCLLIFTFVHRESTFERFHEHAETIYRVYRQEERTDGERRLVYLPPPLSPALEEELPEAVHAARLFLPFNEPAKLVYTGDAWFEEEVLFADPTFFELFSFPLRYGNPGTALDAPNAVVLSAEAASTYFGTEEPLGQSLSIRIGGEDQAFTVTGVAEPIAANSSIRFDILLPYQKVHDELKGLYGEQVLDSWNAFTEIYLLLSPDADPATVETRLPAIAAKYLGPQIQHWKASGRLVDTADAFQLRLQPLTAIHLDSTIESSLTPTRAPAQSYILVGIGLALLLLASINFTTLTVGRSAGRHREVGVRKILGADRGQIMRQFWGEAFLQSVLALLLGLALSGLLLPTFNRLTDQVVPLNVFTQAVPLLALPGLLVLTGLVAGSFSAAALSRLHPVAVLKGLGKIGGKPRFTRVLVVFQFVLSIGLLVSMLTMLRQLDYLRAKDLGFDSEQVVVISTHTTGPEGQAMLDRLKQALVAYPDVLSLTGSDGSFAQTSLQMRISKGDKELSIPLYRVDYDYLETLGIELVEGRDFSRDIATDPENAVLINESMAEAMGWDTAVGREIPYGFPAHDVIGVVRDYHFEPLYHTIRPVVLHIFPGRPVKNIFVRIGPDRVRETLDLLEETWQTVAPGSPFTYSFLDQAVARHYEADERWRQIVSYATLLALSALAISQRTKEIGIRKVLGASASRIVLLLLKEYLLLVAAAFVVATPLAYVTLERWLQDFAYRVEISWRIFLLAGLIALLIALLTVSYQSIKAALADPVKSLRYE